MADRSPWYEGRNLLLCGALVALVVVASGLALGPGRSHFQERQAALREREERLDFWQREKNLHRRITGREREAWARDWAFVMSRIPPAAGNPELVARVARAFQGPTVQNLEVEVLAESTDAEPLEIVIESPDAGNATKLLGEAVRVRFQASYQALARALRDLEAGGLAARVDSLDIRRRLPGVTVDLELTVFSRREMES